MTIPFGQEVKIAKVIPIQKKNDKYLVDNYRPIRLLSTLNKIVETLMYKRVIQFLNKYILILICFLRESLNNNGPNWNYQHIYVMLKRGYLQMMPMDLSLQTYPANLNTQ